ncbi:cupin superfamily protein-domain-containing protein [Pavlovales sp. CCMP2436]|nr:cupin superfamily protein-domain-containing protein [Pavlovales sp. CCMP2436]
MGCLLVALVPACLLLVPTGALAPAPRTLVQPRVVAGEWSFPSDGTWASRRTEFMRDYWQRKPLLIRGMLSAADADIITPDELAGIACEEGVEARIICEQGLADGPPWALVHGPFGEEDFSKLPEDGWTLLVNEVNLVVPDVANLIQRRFADVPNWRADDVMVSYACKNGGIGAHTDNYDVFLLQGSGERRWEIEETPRAAADELLVPRLAVRVLQQFTPDRSWVLQAGDCLYIPPRFPHRGTSLHDKCMTYSMGYRAPKAADLVRDFAELAADGCADDDFFADPRVSEGEPLAEAAGELTTEALDTLEALLRERLERALGNRAELRAWLCAQVTKRRRAALEFEGDHAQLDGSLLVDKLARAPQRDGSVEVPAELRGLQLWRAEGVTFAFARAAALHGGEAALFVDGERFNLAGDAEPAVERLAETLCAQSPLGPSKLALAGCPAFTAALRSLALSGKLYFAPVEA